MSASYPEIKDGAQLQSLLERDKITIVAFYRGSHVVLDSMGMVAGRIKGVRLARCDMSKNSWAEEQYQITANPTFLAFKGATVAKRMLGVSQLLSGMSELIKLVGSSESAADNAGPVEFGWLGAAITTKNYMNITMSIELVGLDTLNLNTSLGGPRVLFEKSKPSGKREDGVESDTDEQLMLFVPFQTAVKLHSIQITSLAPVDTDEDDDEEPSRPRTIKLFCNTCQILGFEDAEDREATQIIELKPEDWNSEGTAVVTTKFVKFQNCSAFTMFFFEPEREGAEKVRIDRIRVIGEVMGEKVDMAKLKKQEEE